MVIYIYIYSNPSIEPHFQSTKASHNISASRNKLADLMPSSYMDIASSYHTHFLHTSNLLLQISAYHHQLSSCIMLIKQNQLSFLKMFLMDNMSTSHIFSFLIHFIFSVSIQLLETVHSFQFGKRWLKIKTLAYYFLLSHFECILICMSPLNNEQSFITNNNHNRMTTYIYIKNCS